MCRAALQLLCSLGSLLSGSCHTGWRQVCQLLTADVCAPVSPPSPPGLLLASGGEFAFVAFGEAVSKGVLPAALTSELYMVVALSMAMVPYLAALGGKLGVLFEKSGVFVCLFCVWMCSRSWCRKSHSPCTTCQRVLEDTAAFSPLRPARL